MIKDTITTIIIFWLFGVLVEFFALRIIPDSHYIEVQSVEPTQKSYNLLESPTFFSNIIYKKKWNIQREDIQYCKKPWEKEYTYYSQYTTTAYKDKPSVTVNWKRRYNIVWPSEKSECYIYSITKYKLHYWIEKQWVYISWPYFYQ